jgi:hypothetical protein
MSCNTGQSVAEPIRHGSIYGRFFQLGYVTRDISRAAPCLLQRMGATQIDLIHEPRDEAGNVYPLLHLAHFSLPGVEIELIEPRLDRPSIYLEALPDRGEDSSLHHMGFSVSDVQAWDRAVATFDAMQTPIVMEGETSQVRFAYFDTRRQAGHYSELVLRFHPETARPLP